jgi:hypothetical protein
MCHLLAGISCYLMWLPIAYLSTDSSLLSSDELRVAVAIGVGFAQLTITGIWLACDFKWANLSFWFVAFAMESLAVMFFSTVSARFVPPSFFVAIAIACAIQFSMACATAKIANGVFRWSLTCSSEPIASRSPKAQFRIKDLLIATALIAIVASFVQSKRSELGSFSDTLLFFGLTVAYYIAMCWPCIFVCLRCASWSVSFYSVLIIAILHLTKRGIFSLIMDSSSDSWLFFVCLDLPFLAGLIAHCVIARCFGYRFC